MLPIFTSLPPRLSRLDAAGDEIGMAYLRACVDSWRAAGFAPYSINAQDEDLGNLPEELGVVRLTTPRDARAIVGKPLVYLSDFFDIVTDTTSGPVAIVNADILLEMSPETRADIVGLQPGACSFHSRTDIQTIDSRSGDVHRLGIDFMLFHSADLRKLDADQFVLGTPWWDHFVPVDARLQGLQVKAFDDIGVYHLAHDEAWNQELWRRYGARCWEVARQRASLSSAPDALRFARALDEASVFSLKRPRQALRSVLRSVSSSGRDTNLTFGLYHLGRANIDFVRGSLD